MKGKTLLYITSALALASLGYYFYEKQRVKALNEKVDSLEDAIKKLEEAKNNS
jgi:hypothetical protein